MKGRLLETAVRPIRIAFLLGRHPSNRLLNGIISANSGMWGGIHNLLCPTDGDSLSDEYMELLQRIDPDCVILAGRFTSQQGILRQLSDKGIHPCFAIRNASVGEIESIGIGVEGILDTTVLQNWQRRAVKATAIVDPRRGESTILDKVLFGIPPSRLKEYLEPPIDQISVYRFKKESQRAHSDYDEIVKMIDITGENLNRYARGRGQGFLASPYRSAWRYLAVGRQDDLMDTFYFWNLRALLGSEGVRWVDQTEVASLIAQLYDRVPPSMRKRLTITYMSEEPRKAVEQAIRNRKVRFVRIADAKTVFRRVPAFAWRSEIRREHIAASEDELVIPVRRPPSFEAVYHRTHMEWVIDVKMLRDEALGTEGFILPSHTHLAGMLTPVRAARLQPRIASEVFSFQVTSDPTDAHIRLRIPGDWEVIREIFLQAGYNIGLSDQGKYMRSTLALFGGLHKLSALLRDSRATAILDEFFKHHSGAQLEQTRDYRRGLTLDDMRRVTISLLGHRTTRRREESHHFVDGLLKELMEMGAVHSGYILDCAHCDLEDWYPIDGVGETFRCRRCLTTQTRPPSPSIFFRLHEALYQAYLNHFTIPALVLDTLSNSTSGSYIFAPQVKLDAQDVFSPEIDIVAICDGVLTIGEAKSTSRLSRKQMGFLESTARRIKAQRLVLSTSSRQSCNDVDCNICSQQEHYADNAFGHGSTSNWGPRERIKDLRNRLSPLGIGVISVCSEDISKREFERNLSVLTLS